jgi:hypothetical protein
MEELTNLLPFDWIRASIRTPKSSEDKDWEGNFLSDCLPGCFEAYCNIFHPIFVDLTIKDENQTWDTAEKENIERIRGDLKEILSHAVITRGTENDLLISRRILWKDLFKKFDLKFHPEVNAESLTRVFPGKSWPRHLVGPIEGSLDEMSLSTIVRILMKNSESQNCFYYFDLMKTSDLKEHLYAGSLSDLKEPLGDAHLRETPTYVWPEDKEWCLFTDHDLTSTFLGGTDRIVNEVLNSEVLEALPARLNDRIDYKADQINNLNK